MASNSSKAIPYVILAIVALSLVGEVYLDTTIDLESYLPLLVAMGLGGAGLSAVKKASEARKQLPKNIEDIVKAKIEEIKNG